MSSTPLANAVRLVLVRPAASGAGLEVACLRRARAARGFGGFWDLPGGEVRPDDGGPEGAAARHAFEQLGLLLVPGAGACPRSELEGWRRALLRQERTLGRALTALGLAAAPGPLLPCGGWRTPPLLPLRQAVRGFLAVAAPDAPLHLEPGEAEVGAWADPADLLARWRRDELLLGPALRLALEALAGLSGAIDTPAGASAAAGALEAAAARSGGDLPLELRPGLRLLPVRTPTLPPATHTNCYIVGDGSELVVIDPASPWEDEQARLDALLDGLAAGGQRVRELILTHHHPDHASSGAVALARRLGVGIAAHARTRERLAGRIEVTRPIDDGEAIDLPADRPGARPRRLTAHLLEGHADGHLVLREEHTGAVIAGDMVAGVGTIVIDPPEGDMARYLRSLERLGDLDPELLLPAHGPPIGDPPRLLREYVRHRLWRESRVAEALAGGGGTVPELVPRAYADVPPALHPAAARSLLAHLLKLEGDGRARRSGEVWSAPAGG